MYNCLSRRRDIAIEDPRNGRTTIFRLIDSQWLLLSASMRAHVHPTQVTIHSHTERARSLIRIAYRTHSESREIPTRYRERVNTRVSGRSRFVVARRPPPIKMSPSTKGAEKGMCLYLHVRDASATTKWVREAR